MSNRLRLTLTTPAQTLIEREVDAVTLPTLVGQITILPDHAPLVSVLSAGEALITDGEEKTPFLLAGGIVEVFQNTVAVLADTAQEPSAIDIAEAERRAQELAQHIAAEPTMDIAAYTELMKELERERAKMQVGKKWQNLPQSK